MIIEDNFILAGLSDVSSPFATGFLVSPDLGKSWATYDLKELGKTISILLSSQKQRRLVPCRPAAGMDQAGGGTFHKTEIAILPLLTVNEPFTPYWKSGKLYS
jgi:hypothetical protein